MSVAYPFRVHFKEDPKYVPTAQHPRHRPSPADVSIAREVRCCVTVGA